MPAVVMRRSNSLRTALGSAGRPVGEVNTRLSGLDHVGPEGGGVFVLSLPVSFERLEDDVGCFEGADAAGGFGVADGDGAVGVGGAGSPDVDRAGFEVDVVPGESGGFAGSQSEVEHEGPHRFEVGAGGRGEELSGLFDGE